MSNPNGRPCIPVAKRRVVVSFTARPAQRDFIKAYGGGSVTRGIIAMVAVCSHLQEVAAKQRLSSEWDKTEKPWHP